MIDVSEIKIYSHGNFDCYESKVMNYLLGFWIDLRRYPPELLFVNFDWQQKIFSVNFVTLGDTVV